MLSSHSRKTAELHNLPVLGWLLEVLIPAMQCWMRRITAKHVGAALASALLLHLLVRVKGDILLADRSAEPKHNSIVLAILNNEFTVKRLYKRGGVVKLVAENPIYPPRVIKPEEELTVWGVVTFNLHKLS